MLSGFRPLTSVIALVLVLQTAAAPMPAMAAERVLIGAGDIAVCGRSTDDRVGALIRNTPGTVFTVGDNAYNSGTAAEFTNCYSPAWGAFRSRTRPSPGNHDYKTAYAAGYFGYFGDRAGPRGRGYYAYALGNWRIYSLNSERVTSAQLHWLRDDLANHPTSCVAAYFHRPLFSSGQHGNDTSVRPLWDALYAARAEIIVNGHDHNYERFAPMRPDGRASRRGIREFVVGSGGTSQRSFASLKPNSQVRQTGTWGALKLTLRTDGYSWEFVRAAGTAFTDSGSGTCH
ncbi:MAG: metallophosphoesterase [Chloroflexota bacterium]|nr:metallophosphoesterase [Chloroflexota bacterium]